MPQVWPILCILSVKRTSSRTEGKLMTVRGILLFFSRCPYVVDSTFNFTCFNVEDPDDPRVGLVNGELSIPGNLLRQEVFDPVVNQVLHLSRTPCARKPLHVQ